MTIILSILILTVGIASTTKFQPGTVTWLRVSMAVLLISAYLTLNTIYVLDIGPGLGVLVGFFEITAVSQSIDLLLFLIGSIILTSWPLNKEPNKEYVVTNNNSYNNNLEKERKIEQGNLLLLAMIYDASEYSLIILFTTLGATLLVSSSDLLSMFLGLGLQSLGASFLNINIVAAPFHYLFVEASNGLIFYFLQENSTLTNFHSFLISGLTLTILLFVLKPYIIVNSTQLLSKIKIWK